MVIQIRSQHEAQSSGNVSSRRMAVAYTPMAMAAAAYGSINLANIYTLWMAQFVFFYLEEFACFFKYERFGVLYLIVLVVVVAGEPFQRDSVCC